MCDDSGLAVIIDTGSGLCKAGFASEDAPRCVFPTVVGRPRKTAVFLGVRRTQVYVGAEAQTRRGVLNLKSPLERGIVTNWEDLDRIWTHVFEAELRIDSKDHPVLLTETPLAPASDRNLMAEIMFEGFEVPAIHIESQAVLAMYACRCTTGVMLDTGDGVTHAVPIHKGVAVTDAIQRSDVAGSDITEYLMRLLNDRGHSFTTSSERQIIRDMKERLAYVALDIDQEMATSKTSTVKKEYTLPDGQIVTVGNETFRCAEPLFTPSILGSKSAGISALIFDAIMNCDERAHADLFANIYISGGNSLFPGLVDRIQNELTTLSPGEVDIHVEVPEDRQYVAWLGGSITASVPLSDYMWLTKQIYAEHGRYHYGCYDPISPSQFRKSKVARFDTGPVSGEELMLALNKKLSQHEPGEITENDADTPSAGESKRKPEGVENQPPSSTDASASSEGSGLDGQKPSKNKALAVDPGKKQSPKGSPLTGKRKSAFRGRDKDKDKEKDRDCVIQ